MDNVIASLLGKAAKASRPGGDSIDHGWSLLKELHARGFDVTVRADSSYQFFVPWHAKDKSLNEYCKLNIEEDPHGS
ncbi:hypothetical protein ACFQH5_13460 [Halomonas salifodinae]|uniref:NYN domain-containing protein n=1 Tax=Halomonas salifodinae TaxID=438745 RepID=A0ABW2EX37_9GAMM